MRRTFPLELRSSVAVASAQGVIELRDSVYTQEDIRQLHGALIVEQLSPASQPSEAMLQHWRGTAFVPGATASQFEQLLLNFRASPHLRAAGRLSASAVAWQQSLSAHDACVAEHVNTIVQDASHDVAFGHLDLRDGYSTSRSTCISEVDARGTDHERVLKPAEKHGFLGSFNTYWTYQQRDGALYIQLEVLSLSRSIPSGLGWALRPYIISVPRESFEFTLRSAINVLRLTVPRRRSTMPHTNAIARSTW